MKVVIDNWSCKTCKSSSRIVTTNKPTPNFLLVGCPSCCPANTIKALKKNIYIWILYINANRFCFQCSHPGHGFYNKLCLPKLMDKINHEISIGKLKLVEEKL